MVNDGTKDNSQRIMDSFSKKDKRFKSFIKENGGLSDARNFGLKYAKGDYLIFIDSDDYIEKDYLEKVNQILIKYKNIDVVRVKCKKVDESGNLISLEKGIGNSRLIALTDLFDAYPFETAWSYIYKLSFWKKNNFEYMKGKIHEDFGLTPEILIKAKKIYYLDYYAYNYVQRYGSIMSQNNDEKIMKRCYDILEQYDRLIKLKYDSKYTDEYISFITNMLIDKARELKGNNLKKYISELKNRNVSKRLLNNSIKRKIKRIILKISLNLYLKIS